MTKAGEAPSPLRTYFLECFAPATSEAAVEQAGRCGRLAASRITRSGRHAAYVGTHVVARDEIVIHVVRCADEDTAAEVGRAAGWPVERVIETVFIDRS
jgi:hypothetical protein